MRLIELYKSVQGESTFTGVPCIFVRFAGCNLRCSWCDSTYTFHGGQPFTEDEVVAQIEALHCPLIEFTGGEPMLHARELLPLMDRLLKDGRYTLMMETSGERPLGDVGLEDAGHAHVRKRIGRRLCAGEDGQHHATSLQRTRCPRMRCIRRC